MAKQPQDRKSKKPTVKEVEGGKSVVFPGIKARGLTGKVLLDDSGQELPLKVTVPTEALDDFELLDDMRGLDDGNASRMPAMLRRMVGNDYKTVLEALRDRDTGRVSITSVSAWMNSLLEALDPNS